MSLRDEIKALPPEVLATKDSQAVTDALNAANPVKVGMLARGDFAEWAATTGMRAKIEDHAVNPNSPLRSIALACRDVIAGATAGIDFARPSNRAMLAAWVSAQSITQAQADELVAKATVPAHYDEFEVRCVCWSDDGVWQV